MNRKSSADEKAIQSIILALEKAEKRRKKKSIEQPKPNTKPVKSEQPQKPQKSVERFVSENGGIRVVYRRCTQCGKSINSETSSFCSQECQKKNLQDYTSRLKETVGIMEKRLEEME